MELDNLYDIASREKIPVINFKMKNKAIIGKTGKDYCIGLNYSKIDSYCEEKEMLAEELGHYYYDSLYCSRFDISAIQQKEYKAKKWKSITLVTKNSLYMALRKGCNTFYEIAEELEVTEDTVKFAYNYYKENGLISTNEEILSI